ncbi:MAG: TIM barrel protein, partial [Candidatus Ornithospirochaeta sp.]
LDTAFSRARRLSIEKIIFGSGKARGFSNPTTRGEAEVNLYTTIEKAIIPKAKEYGITVLIEPLTRRECNLINTLEEGYKVVEEFSDENLLLMADLFHMKNNGEDLSSLETCLSSILHIHIAGKDRELEDTIRDPFLTEGLELLKSLGYDSTISLETKDGDKKKVLDWLKAII